MTAPAEVDGAVDVPLPVLTADQILIDEADFNACLAEHKAPHFGCPTCFLLLAYSQPLADFAHRLIERMVERQPGFQDGREVLEHFNSRHERVRQHIATGQRAKS